MNGYNYKSDVQYDKKIILLSTKTGKVLGSINLGHDAVTPHDLELSDDASEIYVSTITPPKIYKYVLVNYKSMNLSFLNSATLFFTT